MKRKRIINTVLSLSTALSFMLVNPMKVVKAAEPSGKKLSEVINEQTGDKITLNSGNYYLDKDIKINKPLSIPLHAGVTLDLNGNVLCQTNNCNAIIIGDNNISETNTSRKTYLDIKDSNTNKEHFFFKKDSGLMEWIESETPTEATNYSVKGGVITNRFNNQVQYGGLIDLQENSLLYLYNGNLIGGSASNGGAINARSNSEFYM